MWLERILFVGRVFHISFIITSVLSFHSVSAFLCMCPSVFGSPMFVIFSIYDVTRSLYYTCLIIFNLGLALLYLIYTLVSFDYYSYVMPLIFFVLLTSTSFLATSYGRFKAFQTYPVVPVGSADFSSLYCICHSNVFSIVTFLSDKSLFCLSGKYLVISELFVNRPV
ncbi:hypothetical protein BDP27DRAFT_239879 [Rhodocollybia butyracea]|uniref:Uncharacterized protein n=1 Tax=Rhodocollybia butyracea TaxID=206335 RepID=A0A9P5U2C0_9AGAR|nr:hypothetical protein BDP27DRAFT_239879 [Rhodocollybia butyracea]